MIPPLPSEQGGSSIGARCRWVVLATQNPYAKETVLKLFMDTFGREPDRCYSPEESDTSTWWMGWVTNQEAKMWVGLNEARKSFWLDKPRQLNLLDDTKT